MRPAARPGGSSILVDKCYAPACGREIGGDNYYSEPMGGLGVGTGVCEVVCGMVGGGGFAHRSVHVHVGRTWFEALWKFGVHASATGSLLMMTSTTMGSSLLIVVSADVKDDAFLARVAQMVKESDDGRWRGFFRAPDSTLRYHRDGDDTARI